MPSKRIVRAPALLGDGLNFTQGGVARHDPVPGYVSYYDASDSLTYDGSNNISACADKGSNGFNATQGSGALRPVRIPAGLNSLDVMEFTAGNKVLSFGATALFSHTSAFTFEIIFREDAGGTYPGVFLCKGASRNLSLYRNDDPGDGTIHFSNPGIGFKIVQPAQGTWMSLLITFNGGTVTTAGNYGFYLQGSAISPTSLAETPPTNRNQLSNDGPVGWVGRVAHVMAWQFEFNSSQRGTQAAHRLAKWNMS